MIGQLRRQRMAVPPTVTVLLLSSRGLSFAEVPESMPRTFRVFEPTLYVEQPGQRSVLTRARQRIFRHVDQWSYVEIEQPIEGQV